MSINDECNSWHNIAVNFWSEICNMRKEILYGNGSVYRVGQTKSTLEWVVGSTECYSVWAWVIGVFHIDINDIRIYMDGCTYLRMNDFISLWCASEQFDRSSGISQLSYGEWSSHITCFSLGPHDVYATPTHFSPTCKDSETSLVLIDEQKRAPIKLPVLVISHTQQHHYYFVVSRD